MLKLVKYSDKLYDEAVSYFDNEYLRTLEKKPNFKISIIARYLISTSVQHFHGEMIFTPKAKDDGTPIFDEGIYRSISHKDDMILVGFGKDRIGVDLEHIRQRSESVLDLFMPQEYTMLGGKSFIQFYVLWTAKESVIKYNLGILDDMKNIRLADVDFQESMVDGFEFKLSLLFDFRGFRYRVLVGGDIFIIRGSDFNVVSLSEKIFEGSVYSVCI